jgi:phosphoribosylformylglycinamidine synthase
VRRVGVVTFPGSNCDADFRRAVDGTPGLQSVALWHKDEDLHRVDAIVLPGGFSYGDYLRCGAIARFSPVMHSVRAFAQDGGPVLGVCNGFQILCEAGLLPGVLMRNRDLSFLCQDTYIRCEGHSTAWSPERSGAMRIPIAHGEGNWQADPDTVKHVEDRGLVVFRYVNAQGQRVPEACPNGSTNGIAGICNASRNVVGLMPHPERVVREELGGTDGRAILGALDPWMTAMEALVAAGGAL